MAECCGGQSAFFASLLLGLPVIVANARGGSKPRDQFACTQATFSDGSWGSTVGEVYGVDWWQAQVGTSCLGMVWEVGSWPHHLVGRRMPGISYVSHMNGLRELNAYGIVQQPLTCDWFENEPPKPVSMDPRSSDQKGTVPFPKFY